MHLQAKEHQGLLVTSRSEERPAEDSLSEPPEENSPNDILSSEFYHLEL